MFMKCIDCIVLLQEKESSGDECNRPWLSSQTQHPEGHLGSDGVCCCESPLVDYTWFIITVLMKTLTAHGELNVF